MSPYTHKIGGSHLGKICNLVDFKKTLLKGSGGEELMCLDEKADLPTRRVSDDMKLSEVA